ncbi:MAG: prepilin-type N-terminal cleavage/methylation domain-containing protein [Thermodesulfobacteriota bacterium]|nr:prepilin-type N-terminal cleavage/methylation domain-containing protein [Thermodesulfobacteriota bacterium]
MPDKKGQGGFTLIEVIITLVVGAAMGALLFEFMGSNLKGSAILLVRVKGGFELNEVMEDITRDYRTWLIDYPDDSITDFESHVNSNYGGWIVSEKTGTIEVDAGNDGDVDILQVAVSDGTRSLLALFTK